MVLYLFISFMGVFLLGSEIKRRIDRFSKPKVNQIVPSVSLISFGVAGVISIVLGNGQWTVLAIACVFGFGALIVTALINAAMKTRDKGSAKEPH